MPQPFQEYLESEIGRSIHEERVLRQRLHPEYNGHLAVNIRHLMTYIFMFCRGPGMKPIADVPIKLWVKYLPDTFERMVRDIYVSDQMFLSTVPDLPGASAPA